MHAVGPLRTTVLAAALITVLACAETSGPENEFMTATLGEAQWSAGKGDYAPYANVSEDRIDLHGTFSNNAIRDTALGISRVPAAVGSYPLRSYWDFVSAGEPTALVFITEGRWGDAHFELLTYYSDTGTVTIDTVSSEWVSGSFWFQATRGGPPWDIVSVTSGHFRLRIQH